MIFLSILFMLNGNSISSSETNCQFYKNFWLVGIVRILTLKFFGLQIFFTIVCILTWFMVYFDCTIFFLMWSTLNQFLCLLDFLSCLKLPSWSWHYVDIILNFPHLHCHFSSKVFNRDFVGYCDAGFRFFCSPRWTSIPLKKWDVWVTKFA